MACDIQQAAAIGVRGPTGPWLLFSLAEGRLCIHEPKPTSWPTVLGHGRTALMGWSVIDLSDDLDWVRTDELALQGPAGRGPLAPGAAEAAG